VDEVAAQHVDADAVVHYGHACMSKSVFSILLCTPKRLSIPRNYRLPVIYVFGKKPVDVQDAAKMLWESFSSSNPPTKVAVFKHDVAYTHEAGTSYDPYAPCDIFLIRFADRLLSTLRDVFSKQEITVSYSPIPRKLGPSNAAATTTAATDHDDPLLGEGDSQDTTPILYIGPPSLALTNLLLTHSTTPVRTYLHTPLIPQFTLRQKVYGYDPTTRQATLQSIQTNKLLMRRYAILQKARDADVFGILVGTLGVGSPPSSSLCS
jgi:diphthamide biosynthesis protein 2